MFNPVPIKAAHRIWAASEVESALPDNLPPVRKDENSDGR
jgi:hypothetical protein